MHKLETKREVSQLTLLLMVTYMITYMARNNFSAIVGEIATSTGFSKSLLAMSLTGSFIASGAGQFLSGPLGDKISPKRLIGLGLLITSITNILISVSPNPWIMLGVWSINGFAQSFIWPPLTRMMATLLSADAYKNAVTKVNCGGSVGTILVYLTAPIIIMLTSWKGVFVTSSLLTVGMLIVWHFCARDIPREEVTQQTEKQKISFKMFVSPMMLMVFLAIILQGMLNGGVTSWMPTFVAESFQIGNEISIVSSVLLPIFAIIFVEIGHWLYQKVITHPLACAGLFFGVGAVFTFLLYQFSNYNVILTVTFAAILTGAMNGVNLMLVSMLPQYYERYGSVATVAGILNASSYAGCAIATYGNAALSETIGWSDTIFVWFLIGLVGMVVCALCIKPWNKKFS